MSDHPSSGKGTGGNSPAGNPRIVRTLAILLMVVGVAAFVFSRLVIGDQILCLLGSTLITFFGLAILFYDRRLSGKQGSAKPQAAGRPLRQRLPWQSPEQGAESSTPVNLRQVPPGLRAAARRQAAARPLEPLPPESQPEKSQPVETLPGDAQPEPATEAAAPPGASTNEREPSLVDRVVGVLEQQGDQVDVDTERGGRGILQVQAQDGQKVSIMVLEGQEPVDVSEVRALYALVAGSRSGAGYLVSSAPFTQQAYDWAGPRGIRLVREDELGEFSI